MTKKSTYLRKPGSKHTKDAERRAVTELHQLRPAEAAWFQAPAIVRPQAEGEQPQAQRTFRPSPITEGTDGR